MRVIAALLVLSSPAAAWEFSPTPICTLESAQGAKVTYDGALYTIALTRDEGWPVPPIFSIRFDPFGPLISTPRHVISGDTLTVSDTGFGNVLSGLARNETATAILGDVSVRFDLTGAAEPTRAFRACEDTPLT